jgi:hypothetical protein
MPLASTAFEHLRPFCPYPPDSCLLPSAFYALLTQQSTATSESSNPMRRS